MPTKTRSRVAILTTSDIHGFIQPYSYTEGGPSDLGFARTASLIEKERSIWGDHMLYVDNGDNLQGSPLAYYQAKVDSSGENVMISSLNAAGCSAAVVGNHEFNFGLSYLRQAMRQSAFPWLSANILSAASGEAAFGTPYLIHDTPDGIRIAVLGLTTAHIPVWELPEHIEGLRFVNPVECAKRWVPYLRNKERADVIVVAYHGGFERDLQTGVPTETLTGENQGFALCQEVEGIDVLLTGHQHRQIDNAMLNGVCVIQPGTQGQFLGRVILELELDEKAQTSSRIPGAKHGWRVVSKQAELLPAEEAEPLDRILELTAPVEAGLQRWLDEPIGETNGNMRITDVRQARLEEHPFIEWINRVQMEVSGARISCTALFDESSSGFGKRISMRDILANYKFPNTLRVLRVTGRDIREALEKSAEYFMLGEDGQIGVSPAFLLPKPQPYNYDMWEGVEYVLDVSRPPGERVVQLEVNGSPLLPDAEYDVVMNNYRAGGGGGFDMFRGKPVVRELQIDMAELLADYIRVKRIVTASVNHNWKVIGGN